MFNVSTLQTKDFKADIEAVLKKYGASEHPQYMLVVADGEKKIKEVQTVLGDGCGTCASMMLSIACADIEAGIINGSLHVHAMPALYADSALFG